jgi:anti-sigma factor RsiW
MNGTRLERVVLASARHPRRTIGAWIAAMVVAFVAIGALLGGALTTEGNPTNNPQSQRAKDVREAAFPAASSAGITDIVVVHSSRYTVDAPQYRAFVGTIAGEVRGAEDVESIRTYLSVRDPSLVSKDRHATMVQFAMPDESSSGIDDVLSAVQRADASPSFEVTVTG